MLQKEGYKIEKKTIDIVKANIFSIFLFVPTLLIFGLPYYLIWGININLERDILYFSFLPLIIMLLGIILHELIHGITWAIFAKKGFKSITFGVLWKFLTPYCHCKEPLNVRQYIIGSITPAIFLGFLPSIFAIGVGNIYVLFFGIIFIIVASGDFMVINLIRKESKDTLVQDHPSECGYYVYKKIKNEKS